MGDKTPSLEIHELKFKYPGSAPGAHWVVDVSALVLMPGEQALLTGASGRGKSTLLQIIAGLIEPNHGNVRIQGKDIHALGGAKRDLYRGSQIGMIFQNFNLLRGFSARENVLAALMFSDVPRKEHDARALELLQIVGIPTPERDVAELSIGQMQRVAVARAVATNPALVLADEPTASLDPENAGAAMDLIQSTCQKVGAALLCTSHDPSMADRFNRRESLDQLVTA
ncbi:MAG: ATP-binding cassette domain-containing protein [Phycisphaerales bacterium]|nr:ATP-binding cassette domain-containing protein [Phycisphaerales bacterium]MCB9836167.1 ATP-binding cassette domain-containing protein [Phycisphaera sp.]